MSGAAILAIVVVAYALVAAVLDRRSITAPLVFVTAGVVLGSEGLDVVSFGFEDEVTLGLTELVLALLLFADAATVPLAAVESDAGLPIRLLGIGLPLTIVLGTLAAGSCSPTRGGRSRRWSRRSSRLPTPRSGWRSSRIRPSP